MNTEIKGGGSDFIFQHGLGGEVSQVFQFLSGLQHYRIISTDCPGHGKSTFEGIKLVSFEQFADQVVHATRKLNVVKAVFGGISMGAGITMNLALRYPQLVKSLVLVRPAWLEKPHPSNLELLYKVAENIDLLTSDNLTSLPWFSEYFNEFPYLLDSTKDQIQRNRQVLKAGLFQKMIDDSPFHQIDELDRLDLPVLVIACPQDQLHPLEMARAIASRVKHAAYYELPSRYQEPEKFQDQAIGLIQDFLDSQVLH